MNRLTLPLFPLHTVLFPGGFLPLRVFEPRYLDMISYCFRNNSGFGICLIREGQEVGAAAIPYKIGTMVKIVDWDQLPDGFLRIDVVGQQRFQILFQKVGKNQLIEAEVELIPNESAQEVPKHHLFLLDWLQQALKKQDQLYRNHVPIDYGNATWVGQRLGELLPLPPRQQQYLLELNDPLERLDALDEFIQSL